MSVSLRASFTSEESLNKNEYTCMPDSFKWNRFSSEKKKKKKKRKKEKKEKPKE